MSPITPFAVIFAGLIFGCAIAAMALPVILLALLFGIPLT